MNLRRLLPLLFAFIPPFLLSSCGMARSTVGAAANVTNSVLYNPVGTAAGLVRTGVGTGRAAVQGTKNAANQATRTAAQVAPYAATAASLLTP